MSRVTIGQHIYESVGHMFHERGMELGLNRPLTAEEALEDPIIAPLLDKVIDALLGERTELPS
jgi:hypothetical protein